MDLKLLISLILNAGISIAVAAASLTMLLHGKGTLASTGLRMLRYFTVDSNLLAGIASLLFAVYEILLLTGQMEAIPLWLYVLKLSGTACVALTMLTVLFFLSQTIEGGLPALLKGANLWYHLLIPLAAIIVFWGFEGTDMLTVRHCAIAVIPVVLYEICYLVNALRHMENGRVSPEHDWYGFVKGGMQYAFFVIPFMLAVTFGICVLLRAVSLLLA